MKELIELNNALTLMDGGMQSVGIMVSNFF
jgi:hypothetical protein